MIFTVTGQQNKSYQSYLINLNDYIISSLILVVNNKIQVFV